jgi:hypothetical protein
MMFARLSHYLACVSLLIGMSATSTRADFPNSATGAVRLSNRASLKTTVASASEITPKLYLPLVTNQTNNDTPCMARRLTVGVSMEDIGLDHENFYIFRATALDHKITLQNYPSTFGVLNVFRLISNNCVISNSVQAALVISTVLTANSSIVEVPFSTLYGSEYLVRVYTANTIDKKFTLTVNVNNGPASQKSKKNPVDNALLSETERKRWRQLGIEIVE